ncbi:MAG: YARHG domain-containing protein [Firmicutes bacterium]|nr:YARHG domain-containing protein [Bacillota bacterium]
MKCTNCGNELQNNARFCDNCGAKAEPISEAAYCPNCGKPLEAGAEFCGECGASVNGAQRQTYTPPQNSGGSKALVAVIIIAAVLAVGALAGTFIYLNFFNDDNAVVETSDDTTRRDRSSRDDDSDTGSAKNKATTAPTKKPSATSTPKAATPSPTPSSMYLFDSDKQYITTDYLDTKTQDEVRLILNEMYARHGYIFQLEQYQEYFGKQSWYTPRYESAETAESYFNDYEKENKKIIVNYETSKGWR